VIYWNYVSLLGKGNLHGVGEGGNEKHSVESSVRSSLHLTRSAVNTICYIFLYLKQST